jgi:branched-chain amino acid transport system ATP-binding protein
LLEMTEVSIFYGKAMAVDRACLKVAQGELVTVLGPNGAGKTSLMKGLAGTVVCQGSIRLNNAEITGVAAHRRTGLGIGHCPEGRRLFPELSVLTNLKLGAFIRRDRDGIEEDLQKLYTLFPVLKERAEQQASTLSGGEQQMVAIGRALMCRPSLLILDEPSVGIAQRLKRAIFQAIRQICDEGTSILLVEQDVRTALAICDRAYVLESGRIVQEGTRHELAHDTHIRRAYLGM